METGQTIMVKGRGGLCGTVAAPLVLDKAGRVEISLEGGRVVTVPASLLSPAASGEGYEVALGPEDLGPSDERQQVVVPVVREELKVGKRVEERERVWVEVVPTVRTEEVDVPRMEERVEVERVPVNRFVQGVEPVRQDGDVTVVPVYEEVLVVERRLRLKEEVRVTRRRAVRPERHRVELRSEEVRVMRPGGGGETSSRGKE